MEYHFRILGSCKVENSGPTTQLEDNFASKFFLACQQSLTRRANGQRDVHWRGGGIEWGVE